MGICRNVALVFIVQYFLAFDGLLSLVQASTSIDSANSDKDVIRGTIVMPTGVNWPSDISVWMFSGTDSRRKTFPNIDGSFVFYGVEDGLHSLDVVAAGLQFPTVKILKHGSVVKASVSDISGNPSIEYPLKLPPVKPIEYFEKRQGFNIWRWLKTPYGIMIAVGVGSMVLLPMLKIDPEEYQQMVKEREAIAAKKK